MHAAGGTTLTSLNRFLMKLMVKSATLEASFPYVVVQTSIDDCTVPSIEVWEASSFDVPRSASSGSCSSA